MSFIKKIIGECVSVAAMAATYIVVANAAQEAWDNGLGDKISEKTEKWFSK